MENNNIQETKPTETIVKSLDNYYNSNDEDTYTQDLFKCGNCGNVWDGCAQCNCYQLECYRIDEEDDINN